MACKSLHSLFSSYNLLYFEDSLVGCSISWISDILVSAASTCICYENEKRCKILLSKPFFEKKSKDAIKKILLHEMIHAYVFLKFGHSDHSYHGDKFLHMMKKINSSKVPDRYRPIGGYNISMKHEFQNEAQCSKVKVRKRVIISDSDESDKEIYSKRRLVKVNDKAKGTIKEEEEIRKKPNRKLIINYESDDLPELDAFKSKSIIIKEPNETQLNRGSSRGRECINTQRAKKKPGELEYQLKGKAKINEEVEKKMKRKANFESDYNEIKSNKKYCNGISLKEPDERANSKGKRTQSTHLATKRPNNPEESDKRVLKTEKKGNERANKAIEAMEALGFNKNLIVNVLKQLYKLYLNKWELIEDDNYRTLADAILDAQENHDEGKGTNGNQEPDSTKRDGYKRQRPKDDDLLLPKRPHIISTTQDNNRSTHNGTSIDPMLGVLNASSNKKKNEKNISINENKKEDCIYFSPFLGGYIYEEEEEEEKQLVDKRSERRKNE